MTKEAFVGMVQWLRKWHYDIDNIAEVLGWDDIYESKLIQFDEVVDQLCAIGGIDNSTREIIDELIFDGSAEIECTDSRGQTEWLHVDEEEYWNVFLNPHKN